MRGIETKRGGVASEGTADVTDPRKKPTEGHHINLGIKVENSSFYLTGLV